MTATITLKEAEYRLKELVDGLAPGGEIIITEDRQPVARLIGERPKQPARPAPGLGKGSIVYMAADFNEPLTEFAEYMQ